MAKVKKTTKNTPAKKATPKKTGNKVSRTVNVIEHEFIIITGGSFVVLLVGLFILFR